MSAESLYLLNRDEIAEIAGIIYATSKNFGNELGNLVNLHFLGEGNRTWFSDLRSKRREEGRPMYDDPLDVRFLLREATFDTSPVTKGIPNFSPDWKFSANSLRKKLNSWSHFSLEPSIKTLEEILRLFADLSERSNLGISGEISSKLDRVQKIQAGERAGTSAVELDPNSEVGSFVETVVQKTRTVLARPPVGSIWNGPIGKRKIQLNRALRDALENGVSVSNQMGPNGKEKIREWLRHYPHDGELSVSDDGAVMGYIRGLPILVGWFGDEPDVSPEDIRGYYLPHEYEFKGNDVLDRQTSTLLSQVATEPIDELLKQLASSLKPGDLFAATTYGDLVKDSDDDSNAVKVGKAHKDVWFPGQLPGEITKKSEGQDLD